MSTRTKTKREEAAQARLHKKLDKWRAIGLKWTENHMEVGSVTTKEPGRKGYTLDPVALASMGNWEGLMPMVRASRYLMLTVGLKPEVALEAWEAIGRAAIRHFHSYPPGCSEYLSYIKRVRTLLGMNKMTPARVSAGVVELPREILEMTPKDIARHTVVIITYKDQVVYEGPSNAVSPLYIS